MNAEAATFGLHVMNGVGPNGHHGRRLQLSIGLRDQRSTVEGIVPLPK